MNITRRQFLQIAAATITAAPSIARAIYSNGITSDQITDLGVNPAGYKAFNPNSTIIGSVLDEIPQLIPPQYRSQITIKIKSPGVIVWRYNQCTTKCNPNNKTDIDWRI